MPFAPGQLREGGIENMYRNKSTRLGLPGTFRMLHLLRKRAVGLNPSPLRSVFAGSDDESDPASAAIRIAQSGR